MKDQKNKINKKIIYQYIGNDVLVYSSEKSELFTFNETAAFIFRTLRKGKSIDEITTEMIKEYDTTGKKAQKDIVNIL